MDIGGVGCMSKKLKLIINHHKVPQRIEFSDVFFRGRKAKIHGMDD